MRFIFILFVMIPFFGKAQDHKKYSMQLDSLFQSYFVKSEPGASVLLVKEGNVIYKNEFGIEDLQTKKPITDNTLFNLGSLSKTFVAYGILKLAADKKLSLSDNLYKYFPDFTDRLIAEKVKIYHLLTHTSGLPDSRKVNEEFNFYITAKDEENFAPLKHTQQLEFEPGSKYHYSNPAFNGLALIIEKVSGMKWQDYIAKIIFKPAGMDVSTITDGPHPENGVAHAYIKNKVGQFEELDYGEEPTFAAAGNGGVWSNVKELWKYEQAIQQNLFLNQAWINTSRAVYPLSEWKDTIPSRLGLSWFITQTAGMKTVEHTGSQGGFRTDYLWIPEKKIFYVILCNTPKPLAEIRAKLVKQLQNENWLDKK